MPTGIYKRTKEMYESQSGSNNSRWKGNHAKKLTIHGWIARHKPKPKYCEECKKEKKLCLANIKNHNYTRNVNDYKWLCYSCHMNLDLNKKFCKYGHKLEGNNLIINNRGHRVCRICRTERNRKCIEKQNKEDKK